MMSVPSPSVYRAQTALTAYLFSIGHGLAAGSHEEQVAEIMRLTQAYMQAIVDEAHA